MFRSVSNTSQNPAVQPEFDLTYGMWWAYIWGSNTSLSDKGIEIDYGGGISPKWKNFTFTVGGLEYTYPSDTHIDYFELKTGGLVQRLDPSVNTGGRRIISATPSLFDRGGLPFPN